MDLSLSLSIQRERDYFGGNLGSIRLEEQKVSAPDEDEAYFGAAWSSSGAILAAAGFLRANPLVFLEVSSAVTTTQSQVCSNICTSLNRKV